MKAGTSRLFELRPDPYDKTQRKFLRICLVSLTLNIKELILLSTSLSMLKMPMN